MKLTVRVIHPGDTEYKRGDIVDLQEFLDYAKVVLENGGEIPTAILEGEVETQEVKSDDKG